MKSLTTVVCVFCLSFTAPLFGQDQSRTLEDIRLEIETVSSQIDGLRSELLSTSAASGTTSSGEPLVRLGAIESELRNLTGQVEELRFKIDQIVKDASNRMGDLEFRLTELEGGDVNNIGQTRELGESGKTVDNIGSEPQLTVTESSDFSSAFSAYEKSNYAEAADLFSEFENTYPGGPLTSQAQYFGGLSRVQLSDWKAAGRSFLKSFSNDPNSEFSPDALYWLGVSLGNLGKTQQACQTFEEVQTRFPENVAASSAGDKKLEMGCS